MYHLKLCKGLSYKGVVAATRKAPDVFTEDKATSDAAVASGYFRLVEATEEKPGGAPAGLTGHLDRAQLEGMVLKDLKAIASDMGIAIKGLDKPGIIEAIVAVEVEAGPEEDGEGEPDFGEDGEGAEQ